MLPALWGKHCRNLAAHTGSVSPAYQAIRTSSVPGMFLGLGKGPARAKRNGGALRRQVP